MSTDHDRADLRERVETFAANNPTASVMDVLGGLALDPEHRPLVAAVLSGEDEAGNADSPDTTENEPVTDGSSTPEPVDENPEDGFDPDPDPDPGQRDGEVGAYWYDDHPEVHRCFTAAIEFFHDHIDDRIADHHGDCNHPECPGSGFGGEGEDCQRPDTARDYFHRRGYDDAEIDTRKLGWVPPDTTGEVFNELVADGFTPETIRETGLFMRGDPPSPLHCGRYALPYIAGGEPAYLIARCTGKQGGGHPDTGYDGHPTDLLAGKYGKLRGPYDDVVVKTNEPIFGVDSVEHGEPLVIAGGITDAIALQDVGYSCISPVTTVQFKGDHRDEVLGIIEEFDIPEVYIINDRERASIDAGKLAVKQPHDADALADADEAGSITGAHALNMEQFGEGLRGAFGNAEFLLDAGVNPKFVNLPNAGGALRKVDPDDCITDDWADLDHLLAAAKNATGHRGYRQWKEHHSHETRMKQAARPVAGGTAEYDGEAGGVPDTEDASALYSLSIDETAKRGWSYRGVNPLGHHGDSENYTVLVKRYNIVYDYKYKVGYNPLTYLLCEAGEREPADPHGPLSIREHLIAWRTARDKGLLPDNDPIPLKALHQLIVESDDPDHDYETDDWVWRSVEDGTNIVGTNDDDPDEFDVDVRFGMAPGGYNDALDVLDKAGIAHGRDHIDAETVGGGQQYEPEKSTPPAVETEPFDADEYRASLCNERYRAWLDRNRQTTIWGDDAGTGKTTNAGLGAFERERPQFAAFDKHVKAHEFIHDPATPDDWMHLKGTGQPRHDCCMDAQADADEASGETPHCSTHGHPADWPRMCPVKNRDKDDPVRQRYDALAEGLGEKEAHLTMGLWTPDEHEWHPPDAPWGAQFDALTDENGGVGVPRVAGVHEYQMLETAGRGRDPIVDESPRVLASDEAIPVDKLLKAAVRLGELAAVHDSDSDHPQLADNLEAIGTWADDLAHELSRGKLDTRALADDGLEAPDLTGDTIEVEVDPDAGDLPADIDPETVEYREKETRREYDGLSRNYREYTVQNEGYVGERELLAEAVAQVKLTYNESVRKRLKNDEWSGEPFCIDDLLAAAIEAGPERYDLPLRQAIAIDPVLRSCPWCGHELDAANGARVCRECGWDERKNTVTRKDGPEARITAWLETTPQKIPGDEYDPSLCSKHLPLADDLPDPLVLDATATPEKVAALYGDDTDDVPLEGTTPLDLDGKVRTVQVVGGHHPNDPSERFHVGGQYHAKTIEDSPTLQERIQSTITHVCDVHHRPLFGIRRKLIGLFEWPENAEVLHYGGARGLNKDDCDTVCCIGAPHPDMDDVQRLADALAQGRDDIRAGGTEYSTRRNEDGELAANEPVYRKLLYEDEDGDGLAVPTKAYSGLVGALFREAREKELEQFVHRIRPLLVDPDAGDPMKHAYLLTDVPTDLPIDEVVGFEELADPLEAFLPVPEGGVELVEAIADVAAGNGPDGFRADQLIETRANGEVANNRRGLTQLAKLSGVTVTYDGDDHAPSYDTVSGWVDRLEDLGLLVPESYEQRRGVAYAADVATLKSALEVVSSSAFSEVAAVRRFAAEVRASMGSLDWLRWAREAFDLGGDRTGVKPPPNPGG